MRRRTKISRPRAIETRDPAILREWSPLKFARFRSSEKAPTRRPIAMVRFFVRLYAFQKLLKKRLAPVVKKDIMSSTRRLMAKMPAR